MSFTELGLGAGPLPRPGLPRGGRIGRCYTPAAHRDPYVTDQIVTRLLAEWRDGDASALDPSRRTVPREWALARSWLCARLGGLRGS